MERQEEIIEILLKEYYWIKQSIQSNMSRIEKGLGFFFISISLAFGVGIKEKIYVLMFIIPWIAIGFTFYVILYLEGIFTDSGYAATIEERINNLLDSEVLKSELKVSVKLQQFTWPQILTFVIFGIIFIIVLVISIWFTYEQYKWATMINTLLILIFFAIAIYFLITLRSLAIKSQKIVKELSC
jgi:hypothetical protein